MKSTKNYSEGFKIKNKLKKNIKNGNDVKESLTKRKKNSPKDGQRIKDLKL